MKKITIYSAFIGLFFGMFGAIPSCLYGQSETVLVVLPGESTGEEVIGRYFYTTDHSDSASAAREAESVVAELIKNGYAAASLDGLRITNDTLYATIYAGKRFYWGEIKTDSVDSNIVKKAGIRPDYFRNRPLNFDEFSEVKTGILDYLGDNGHPFAVVVLDSLTEDENHIDAVIKIDRGRLIVFDTLQIVGTAKVKPSFLQRYLRIMPGSVFDRSEFERLTKKLSELSYAKIVRPATLTFEGEKATPIVYIDKRKSNRIDGILGVLPNETGDEKLLVTGEFEMQLDNLFGSGKRIFAKWQSLKKFSQSFKLEYFQPNLFNSGLDILGNLNLLKEDTTYLNIDRSLTVFYNSGKFGKVNLAVGLKTTDLLTAAQFPNINQLPDFSDTDLVTYALGYSFLNTDDYFYPRKGFDISGSFSVGTRTIKINPVFDPSLYDGLDLKSAQYSFTADLKRYFKTGKSSVVLSRIAGGSIIGKNLFLNELFRVGGLRSFRGFNENFFFASSYLTATAEFRLFTDESTYFSLFVDQGWVQSRGTDDFPTGMGAGVSFETPAGVFNFAYSLGRSRDRALSFRLSKIHFGLTGRF